MRYFYKRDSSRARTPQKSVRVLETHLRADGQSVLPALHFRVGEKVHTLIFESAGEAQTLLACATKIARNFDE